jgi:hypothetical protein
MKLFTVIIPLFFSLQGISQQTAEISTQVNPRGIVTVKFNQTSEIKDLLLLITSPNGETVYIEHKTNFSGNYHNEIDLKPNGNGKYLLKVIRDESVNQAAINID